MYKEISNEMLSFLQKSPSAFHAVDNIKNELKKENYEELLEGQNWNIKPGGKYFVTRNNSSIIALNLGKNLDHYGFNVVASHTDTLHLKLKKMQKLK